MRTRNRDWTRKVFLLILIFGSFLVTFLPRSAFAPVRAAGLDLFRPVLDATSAARRFALGTISAFGPRAKLLRENENLRNRVAFLENLCTKREDEIDTLRRQLSDLVDPASTPLYKENELGLADVVSFKMGEAIADDFSMWPDSMVVNLGARDRVDSSMVAIWANAVVGKVVLVGRWSCQVQLLTDPNFKIWVATASDPDVQGILRGSPDGLCSLEFVPMDRPIADGEVLITTGLADVYPAGLVVGTVVGAPVREHTPFYRLAVKARVNARTLTSVVLVKKSSYLKDLPDR